MTEEEVSKQLLQMNNDLYYRKLVIDLEKVFENDGKMIDSDKLKSIIESFFNELKENINKLLENNKGTLTQLINDNNQEEYVKQIHVLSSELIKSIDNLYKEKSKGLIDGISNGYQEFTRKRIESLVKELIYQHFINSLMSTSNDMNKLLMNKYQSNNTYLENMNNKTVAM